MSKLPSLRAIQAFEAFGRLGTVTASAQEIEVTIGAISQQLRKLEDQIGLRLVERRGKSIVLTTRGRHFHDDVKAAFDMLRDAQAKLERVQSEATFTISCLPSVAAKWIGAQLFDWQATHSGATVHLIGDDVEPQLRQGLVDFRLSYGHMITQYPHRAELFADWVVPACAPALLARHPLFAPADILAAPLLGIEWARNQGTAPTWTDWADHAGVPRRAVAGEIIFSLSTAAINAAINGRGFVLAQISMVGDDLASGRLVVPFDIRMRLPQVYFLAWDPAAIKKPLGRELRDWIVALARRQTVLSSPRAQSHNESFLGQ